MNRRKQIAIVSLSALCLCVLVIALATTGHEDILARIQREINQQGYSMVSESQGIDIRAQTARMEGDCLILEAGGEPGKEPYVLVNLCPGMGSPGICSAKRVSVELAFDHAKRLKLTFHQAQSIPRHMVGRTQYVYLPEGGKIYQWYLKLRYDTQDWLKYRAQKKSNEPLQPAR